MAHFFERTGLSHTFRKRMRFPFTDSWNSFWHFTFGVTGTASPLVFLVFLAYQLKDPSEVNILIDLAEFLVGYYVAVYTLRRRTTETFV